jgi:hypothetical protein
VQVPPNITTYILKPTACNLKESNIKISQNDKKNNKRPKKFELKKCSFQCLIVKKKKKKNKGQKTFKEFKEEN